MNVDYKIAAISPDTTRLINLLSPRYPADKVFLEIEKGFAKAVLVYFDNVLMGLLILKQFVQYDGKKTLVVEHGIADDFKFTEVLSRTLFQYALSSGFDEIHQHADSKALVRLYEKFYGEPQEWIFKQDLKLWEKDHLQAVQARQLQAKPAQ